MKSSSVECGANNNHCFDLYVSSIDEFKINFANLSIDKKRFMVLDWNLDHHKHCEEVFSTCAQTVHKVCNHQQLPIIDTKAASSLQLANLRRRNVDGYCR